MAGERYVVLGLASARVPWFPAVAQWANSAAIPVEFVKCVSAEEVRSRLDGGRAYSALLADATLPSVDRDLLVTAGEAHCPVIVVHDGRLVRDWRALGATAVLPTGFDRAALLDQLSTHARLISRTTSQQESGIDDTMDVAWRGLVAAVVGGPGTGTSTAAIALAQGLADQREYADSVVLADLCRHAEQAMLHDTGVLAPGVQELVEAHRAGRPTPEEIRALCFHISARRYDLLLGLRRGRFWPSLRPAAFRAAFTSLTNTFAATVIDTDADFETEGDAGSVDVEERTIASRTGVREADVVFAIGHPSMKGLHTLTRVLSDLVDREVDPERIVPVFNLAPRSPRTRSGFTAALADLTPWRSDASPPPIFLPVRSVDHLLRVGARVPAALSEPLQGACAAVLARMPPAVALTNATPNTFSRVVPGSLGMLDEAS